MNQPTQLVDDFDRKILAIVQRNNLIPHRQIADEVHLSIPAVARRLARLRKDGIISSDGSVVRQDCVGSPLTIIVHVTLESEAVGQLDAMREKFLACPQVQQCYYVTGDIDFILIMITRDMQQYEALTRSLFFQSGNVRRFRTFVAMERVKASMNVPLATP